MPTAASWTDAGRDLGHVVRFRLATVRRPRTLAVTAAGLVAITVAVATLPALADVGAEQDAYAHDALTLLPTALTGFLVVATVAAVASGGGRELLERDQAAIHPIGATVDHLGALLLAPLNLVWILQAWILLAGTAYAVPSHRLPAAQVGVVLWLLLSTACAQLVAWSLEAVRRTRSGAVAVRVGVLVLAAVAGWLQLTHRLTGLLDAVPTRWLLVGLVDGPGWGWVVRTLLELAVLVAAVVIGARPASLATRRVPREEIRVESGTFALRRPPRTALGALVRTDRASVWRAVPVRRGVAVLAVGPALAALAGELTWTQMTVLPGLIAAGGALLFGVNTWCLDGRGALWRESLPVAPATVFLARTWVLAELLLAASTAALVPGVRAGVPTAAQLIALACTWVVVVLQVVSAAMRWSAARPLAVDLRSPRAIPAPPLAMVAYSARLAVTTTLTSLVFAGLSRGPDPALSALVAAPFLLWSGLRLRSALRRWEDPVERARVVTTVAA